MASLDTIYALSSGAGTAGVAVIRLTGPVTLDVIRGLCGVVPQERTAKLTMLRDPVSGELIDRGLVLWFPGPRSFTGEDSAEFQVHGSHAVVNQLFHVLGRLDGVRGAEPGEFTLRAFRNGKLSLVEVEGLSDLISARTEAQRRQALSQTSSQMRDLMEGWRSDIVKLLARVEAAVDFIDEAGVAEAAQSEIASRLSELIGKLEKAAQSSIRGEAIREGIRVVIAGPPNAGKSSLLNYLAGREAAIVSSRPGTTRDVIEVIVDLGGLPVIFSDTAGLRSQSDDEIELIGMERARRELGRADVVVWLTARDIEGTTVEPLDSDAIRVENKCDLPMSQSRLYRNEPHYQVSVRTGKGMATFLEGLKERITRTYVSQEPAIIVRARQRECVNLAINRLKDAENHAFSSLELQAEDLRGAAIAIGRLTGRINIEDVLGEIFAEFCIGK